MFVEHIVQKSTTLVRSFTPWNYWTYWICLYSIIPNVTKFD